MMSTLPKKDSSLSGCEILTEKHVVQKFRCGKPGLDAFLKRYALKNQVLGSSRTYVVHRDSLVVGYYSITYGDVAHAACPASVTDGMPTQYEIPVVILARLAVDKKEQGKGLGPALLKDACLRIISAGQIAGLRAVVVHAIDEQAKAFYKHFGFEDCPASEHQVEVEASPTSERQVMMTINDLRETFGAV
jgi:predicted N-acetyltransferase YhbS